MENTYIYMAGLFDGEGSVMIAHTKKVKNGPHYYHLKICLSNTHWGCMTFLRDNFGGCINWVPEYKGKRCWFWTLHSRKAANLLQHLLPYMVIKKREAKIAVE